MVDFTHMINEAGLDALINNTRVRATPTNPMGTNWLDGTGAPYTATSGTAMSLTAAQMGTGICVLKPSANVNLTFDTAANIVAYFNSNSAGAQVGDYMCVLLINGATANTLAPQAANGVTFDANQANTTIAAATSRYMFFRLTNVTLGSEAVVAYW